MTNFSGKNLHAGTGGSKGGGMDSRPTDQVAEVSSKYSADKASHAIPVGYKQTEVGVIPEDWDVIVFGAVLSIRHGKNQKQIESESGLYPILATGGQIGWGNSYLWDKPSVLIGRKGTINKPRYCDEPFWTVDTLFYSEIFNQADTKFTYYKFCMIDWMQYNEASGVPSLNASTIENVAVAYPQKKEQTAIANALSDVDALISELEKLIAKKQAIKTATMQQLLTGRTRLPLFALREDGTPKGTKPSELGEIPEDWEISKIGDFAPLQRGFDLPSSNRVDGKYPVVYSNGIVNTHCHFQVKGPGVVTGRSGTLGKVHYVEDDYWPHNTSLWVTKFNGTDPKFIYFVFTFIGFERFASGSGVPTLNRNDAHSYKVLIPSTEAEQTSIATILSDMDAEIQALEQRLGKTRQIKQGMMQELLTGKTRLIKGEANG